MPNNALLLVLNRAHISPVPIRPNAFLNAFGEVRGNLRS